MNTDFLKPLLTIEDLNAKLKPEPILWLQDLKKEFDEKNRGLMELGKMAKYVMGL